MALCSETNHQMSLRGVLDPSLRSGQAPQSIVFVIARVCTQTRGDPEIFH